MLARPAILFGSVPVYSPFPMMHILSAVATAAFGVELAIARVRVHPRRWLYTLLASCVALGVLLTVWSGCYALYGPYEVDWRVYFTPPMPNPWFGFYEVALFVNIVISLLTLIGVIVMGKLLQQQKA